MAKRNTYVVAGDFKDCWITAYGKYKDRDNIFCIITNPNRNKKAFGDRFKNPGEFREISKKTVKSWEIVNEKNQKSLTDGVIGGLVGGALLGPLGMIIGANSPNIKTNHIVVSFRDGKKSLIELAGNFYDDFVKAMF